MKALVLAAGKSTRIAAAVPSKPKPLIEIAGQPVLFHNLDLLKKHGIRDIWINLHYEPDQIKKAVGDGKRWNAAIHYSEEKEILGTAGAVRKLEKDLAGEPFWVLYGDNYTDCDLVAMLKYHKEKKSEATIAVFDYDKNPNSQIAGGTVATEPDGRIQQFLEGEKAQGLAKAGAQRLVNSGIYLLEPSVLPLIPAGFSDFGKDVFPALLRERKKIYAYTMLGFCFAVDTPEAMKNTQAKLQRKP